MRKKVEIVETKLSMNKMTTCTTCLRPLLQDYFTPEELLEKEKLGLKLGLNQRLSVCKKCGIQFINSK